MALVSERKKLLCLFHCLSPPEHFFSYSAAALTITGEWLRI
jgi:hypothetical protein